MSEFQRRKDTKHLSFLSLKNNTSVAIELSNGRTCLYNPVVKSENSCEALSSISHLLSPNHYHNKSLLSFNERFPKASLCATSTAIKRLGDITGLKFKSLTALKKLLPPELAFLEPAGLKTGEVWLRFQCGKNTGWVVGDAFCGNKTGTGDTKTPQLLGTFPSYGIADKQTYKDWVLDRIEKDKPTMIIPCHGSVIINASLSGKLLALLKKM